MSGDGTWATPGREGGDGPPPPPGGRPAAPGAPPTWPGGSPPPPGAPPPPPPGGTPPPPGGGFPPGVPPARQRVGLVPLYPMGVGDVLDTAFRMLRATAGPAVLLVLLLLGPLQVASSAGFQSPFTSFSGPVPEVIDPRLLVLTLVAGIATLLVSPLVQAALTWLGAHADASGAPSWRDALRQGARHYWRTLGVFALLALVMVGLVAVAIGVVALLAVAGDPILGVVVGVPLALVGLLAAVAVTMLGYLTVPCVVVEELGPVRALRRAGRLLRARFWPTVGLSLLIGLLLMLLGGAVSSVISVPAFFGFPGAWAFIAIGSILDQLVRAPLGAYAALAIHVDQRIRTEGYDVAVLVSELRR